MLTHGLAGMTGASPGGCLRDLTGNYTLTFMACIIVPLLGLPLYSLLYPGRQDTAAG